MSTTVSVALSTTDKIIFGLGVLKLWALGCTQGWRKASARKHENSKRHTARVHARMAQGWRQNPPQLFDASEARERERAGKEGTGTSARKRDHKERKEKHIQIKAKNRKGSE